MICVLNVVAIYEASSVTILQEDCVAVFAFYCALGIHHHHRFHVCHFVSIIKEKNIKIHSLTIVTVSKSLTNEVTMNDNSDQ